MVLCTKFPLKYETYFCDGQSASPSGVCCREGPLYGRLSCDEVWTAVCEEACGLQGTEDGNSFIEAPTIRLYGCDFTRPSSNLSK